MLIAVILLSLLVLILLISFIYYRRQVMRLSRHVAFMNEHKTKMMVNDDIHTSELSALTEEINRLAVKTNRIEEEYCGCGLFCRDIFAYMAGISVLREAGGRI